MTLDVIGTGFGRTGTLSMKDALEQIGFGPCYHMEEVFKHPSHLRLWHDRSQGAPLDFAGVFGAYRSAVDFPVSAVWREVIARYPDAKVVHTVRDPERWWQSTNDTIFRTSQILEPWFQRVFPPARRAVEMVDGLVWDGLFDGRFPDKDHAVAVFERQTADVVAELPADRLLVFEVAEGWEPLCAFLDVPVPDGPFPRVNDAATMQRRLMGLQALVAATKFAPIAVAGSLMVRRRRLRRRGVS